MAIVSARGQKEWVPATTMFYFFQKWHLVRIDGSAHGWGSTEHRLQPFMGARRRSRIRRRQGLERSGA